MKNCVSCNKKNNKFFYKCNNCGATFCEDCKNKTKNICPYCYSNLEISN